MNKTKEQQTETVQEETQRLAAEISATEEKIYKFNAQHADEYRRQQGLQESLQILRNQLRIANEKLDAIKREEQIEAVCAKLCALWPELCIYTLPVDKSAHFHKFRLLVVLQINTNHVVFAGFPAFLSGLHMEVFAVSKEDLSTPFRLSTPSMMNRMDDQEGIQLDVPNFIKLQEILRSAVGPLYIRSLAGPLLKQLYDTEDLACADSTLWGDRIDLAASKNKIVDDALLRLPDPPGVTVSLANGQVLWNTLVTRALSPEVRASILATEGIHDVLNGMAQFFCPEDAAKLLSGKSLGDEEEYDEDEDDWEDEEE